jgi:hypothetical protein
MVITNERTHLKKHLGKIHFLATVIVPNETDRKDTVLHCNTDNVYVLI